MRRLRTYAALSLMAATGAAALAILAYFVRPGPFTESWTRQDVMSWWILGLPNLAVAQFSVSAVGFLVVAHAARRMVRRGIPQPASLPAPDPGPTGESWRSAPTEPG